jgi:hypothetical protein
LLPAVLGLLITLGLCANATAAPVLQSPADQAIAWSDEDIRLQWQSENTGFGDIITIVEIGRKKSWLSTTGYLDLPGDSFPPSVWMWNVCTLVGPDTLGECTEYRDLEVKGVPTLTSYLAGSKLKERIRKRWRGAKSIKTRCKKTSSSDYTCRPTWKVKKTAYTGKATVSLFERAFSVSVRVTGKKKLRR